MNHENFKKTVIKLATSLELIIAICIAIAMALGLVTIVKYFALIFKSDHTDTYTVLKKFLSISLLIVVGIEMVLMLLSHSSRSILELVLFAIARKMLVYSETMLDLILGTIAIAIVFIIKKYLMISSEKFISTEGTLMSAAQSIHDINFDNDLHIPEDKGNTIGGLICHLSEQTCAPVEEGAEYTIGDVQLTIVKMKDGLIEKVMLKNSTKSSHV